ncbi:MAG: hypothetical protein H0W30_15085 [Gemmatimonadaceae bacterium]|nr:hypothetical protein [Gemmatimonadaceae bacterium]
MIFGIWTFLGLLSATQSAIYLLHIGKPGAERLKDRLPVRVSIPDELSRAVVPHFVLQPLVENAFEHGIARKAGPGKVEIAPSASTECCSSR